MGGLPVVVGMSVDGGRQRQAELVEQLHIITHPGLDRIDQYPLPEFRVGQHIREAERGVVNELS